MPLPTETDASPETGNRRALVLAAYTRIAEGGFEGLRTRDVAADVGVNIGTLHYYFARKEDLIRAVVRHTNTKFAATLSGGGTPAEQLSRHLKGIRHLLKTDMQLWKTLSEISLRGARDEAIAAMVLEGDQQWFGFLSDLIGRGVSNGCMTATLNPKRAAALIVSAIKGISMPTTGTDRDERVDLTFDQLEEWLGLSPT